MVFVILVKLGSLTSYTGGFFFVKEQWEQAATVILQFVSCSGYGSV